MVTYTGRKRQLGEACVIGDDKKRMGMIEEDLDGMRP